MKLACPSCGALMSLDVVVGHDGAREAVQIALQLPAPLGKLLIQYVALFRPAKRQLTLDKLAGILGELLPMVQEECVKRDGKTLKAPQPVWAAALQEMQDRNARKPFDRPLTSHGYLLEIIAGKSREQEAAQETRREEQRRQQPAGKRSGMRTSQAVAELGVAMLRGAIRNRPTEETE
jgi:hypothetical protein